MQQEEVVTEENLQPAGLAVTTSFDLASGSIMYSNGTSLEELVIGGTGTVLTEAGRCTNVGKWRVRFYYDNPKHYRLYQ